MAIYRYGQIDSAIIKGERASKTAAASRTNAKAQGPWVRRSRKLVSMAVVTAAATSAFATSAADPSLAILMTATGERLAATTTKPHPSPRWALR